MAHIEIYAFTTAKNDRRVIRSLQELTDQVLPSEGTSYTLTESKSFAPAKVRGMYPQTVTEDSAYVQVEVEPDLFEQLQVEGWELI